MAVLAETVAGLAAKVVRRRTAVFEGLEFEDGQVETASVERDQRAPKTVQTLPEGPHHGFFVGVFSGEGLDCGQDAFLIDLAYGDGDRDMKRDGKEVAALLLPELLPDLAVGIFV